jgi:hypothetical protein
MNIHSECQSLNFHGQKKQFSIFSFDFCYVADELSPVENLGQVLFGERIRPSPYKVCSSFYSQSNQIFFLLV